MSLSAGIVGLPNAGKSTLFNALASRRLAETAARPFTTIEPHEAVVPVHDEDFHRLVDIVASEKSVPVMVTFIDIAGLIKNAHKGEGLGNQFLAKIREVDAIVHVVRAFKDANVAHPHNTHEPGSLEQILEDIEIVNLELELGEIEKKPTIYILNVDEDRKEKDITLITEKVKEKFGGEVLPVSAKIEEEMIDLEDEDKQDLFKMLSWERSALERLTVEAYELLGLISFYTIKGGKEAHAWSIKEGSSAFDAAGAVHTDFQKNFIKAEVVNVNKLIVIGSWKKAKEKGLVRLEGREYVVQNKDVIEFKTGK
jgi:small GTP-binding protein